MTDDCRGLPWSFVPDVRHCPACRGALPADVPSACRTCGPGAARGREDGAPIYPQQVERARLFGPLVDRFRGVDHG
jgi:hypothetical protein